MESDIDMLRQYRKTGDRRFLSAVFERHRRLAYCVAYRVLENAADAEDAVQEAFVRLLRYEPRMREDASLAGLVARVTLHAAYDLARSVGRRRSRERSLDHVAEPAAPAPSLAGPEQDLFDAVWDAVHGLDDRYRVPLLLHYVDGLSTREVGAALGIGQTAVTTRLSRAVGRVRTSLAGQGAAVAGAAVIALLGQRSSDAAILAAAGAPPGGAGCGGAGGGVVSGTAAPVGGTAAWSGGVGLTGVAAKLAIAVFVAAAAMGGVVVVQRLPPPSGAAASSAPGAHTNAGGRNIRRTTAAAQSPDGAPGGHKSSSRSVSVPASLARRSAPAVWARAKVTAKGRAHGSIVGPAKAAGAASRDESPRGGDTIVLKGLVLRPDGKPAPGAHVALSLPNVSDRLIAADSSGRFSVRTPTDNDVLPWRFGWAVVYVPGLAARGAWLRAGENTIRLQPGGSLVGQVIDTHGKPVSGARVRLWHTAEVQRFVPSILAPLLSARTGPDGRWKMDGVGVHELASVQLEEPRFVRIFDQTDFALPLNRIPPIVARPAATIRGRVLFEDGRPAAGIVVFAMSTYPPYDQSSGQTTSDGRYVLHSLSAGTYLLETYDDSGRTVTAALRGLRAWEGQTLQAPDVVQGPGALIEGTVTDAVTGAPIPGAEVASTGPNRPDRRGLVSSATTDRRGRYQLRVAPGESSVFLFAAPSSYVTPADGASTRVRVGKGEIRRVSFKFRHSLTISGRALDAEGKPAAGARILPKEDASIPEEDLQGPDGLVDATGRFTLTGLRPGNLQLVALGDWDLVAPDHLELPDPFPVKVTLYHHPRGDITGRVVDPAGSPLAGVVVRVDVQNNIPNRRGPVAKQERTGPDGRYTFTRVLLESRISLRFSRSGYVFRGGGSLTKADGIFRVTDAALAPAIDEISGRVLTAAGDPAAGATVICPEAGPGALTQTDGEGNFTLRRLPAGPITLAITHETGSANISTPAPAKDVVARLQPWNRPGRAASAEIAAAVLESLAAGLPPRDDLRLYAALALAPTDPDAALRLVTGGTNSLGDVGILTVIQALAQSDPERAAKWAPAHLSDIRGDYTWIEAAAALAQAVAPADPAQANALYSAALARCKAMKPDPSGQVYANAWVAVLAVLLKKPEATVLRDRASAEARKSGLGWGLMEGVAATLIPADPALAAPFLAELTPQEKSRALAEGATELARRDLTGALRLLDRARKLAGGDPEAMVLVAEATEKMVPIVGKTDPAAAAVLARGLSKVDQYSPGEEYMALAYAADFAREPSAAALLREAAASAQSQYESAGELAAVAAHAWYSNPTLGRDLLRQAVVLLRARNPMEIYDDGAAGVGFYGAQIDLPTSRLVLEREYTRQLQFPPDDEFQDSVDRLACAMSAVDMDRALQIARSLPAGRPRDHAILSIADYMLMDAAARRQIEFSHWSRGEP